MWTSCPQACATPGTVLAHGFLRHVVDGKRVEVGTQGHDRTVLTEVGDQAGLVEARDPPPGLLEPLGHQIGGAVLVPRQLGVGVQVAAQVDQLGVVLGDDVGDDGSDLLTSPL